MATPAGLGDRAGAELGAQRVVEVDEVFVVEGRPVGQRDLAVDSTGSSSLIAVAVAERPGVDVDDAGDAIGPGVGDAVRDRAAARVPDEHDCARRSASTTLDHRVDVVAQADARAVGVDRLEPGEGERVHAVAGLFEERRHPLPR